MTDLALTGGTVAAPKISELFTKPLWNSLTQTIEDPVDRRARIEAIASSPAFRQEIARLLPEMERLLEAGNNEQMYGALQPLLLTKRIPDFGKGPEGKALKQAWLSVFYGQLRHFPLAAVRAGVHAYLGAPVNKYPDFPQPGELCSFIEPFAERIRTALYRMRAALAIEHTPQSEIDRKANHQRLAEAGWLDADGNFDIKRCMSTVKRPPAPPRPTESPQQMADRIRGGA